MNHKKETVNEVIERVLDGLAKQNYSIGAIDEYRRCYNGLRRYMGGIGQEYYNAEIGLDYIRQKHDVEINGLYGDQPRSVGTTIRALQVLWDYSEYGSMVIKVRPRRKAFECPNQFANEYTAFLNECEARQYTIASKQFHFKAIHKLLIFLDDHGVKKSPDITTEQVIKFIKSFSGCSTSYLATIISVLKGYLNMLLAENFITRDLTIWLPKIKIDRGGFLPSSWKQEDVRKLLSAIDRNNPKGKRDYAILLIAVRLGLRVGDIRNLKLDNLNWSRKEISIVTQKTKQPHIMPLFDDIGWALIDYLKNGRPETTSDNVFVRHHAPYDAFSNLSSINEMIGGLMNKVGIKRTEKHSIHSLRNTLARVMLENGTPLPVVSEALTHQNIQTTSIYIHIDVEGLKRCALDPEEIKP